MHTLTALYQWGLSAMMIWAPPGQNPTLESYDDGLIRYEQIVEDLAEVAFDPNEKAPFKESNGRTKTFMLMLSIAAKESHFSKDVDLGWDLKAKGYDADKGTSWCLMQIRLGNSKSIDGWYGKDLVGNRNNRKNCFRAGLHAINQSMKMCSYMKGADKLGGYTHGKCIDNNNPAHFRFDRAMLFINNSKITWNDNDIIDRFMLPPEYLDDDA